MFARRSVMIVTGSGIRGVPWNSCNFKDVCGHGEVSCSMAPRTDSKVDRLDRILHVMRHWANELEAAALQKPSWRRAGAEVTSPTVRRGRTGRGFSAGARPGPSRPPRRRP